MSKRKPIRRGRHLPSLCAADLVPTAPEAVSMHRQLMAEGYSLAPSTRPYLRLDGWATIRLTWRKRSEGASVTMTVEAPTVKRGGELIIGAGTRWPSARAGASGPWQREAKS